MGTILVFAKSPGTKPDKFASYRFTSAMARMLGGLVLGRNGKEMQWAVAEYVAYPDPLYFSYKLSLNVV